MASPQLATSSTAKDTPTLNSQTAPSSISNRSSAVYSKPKVNTPTSNTAQATVPSKTFPPSISTKSLNKGQRWPAPSEVPNASEPGQKPAPSTDMNVEDSSKSSSSSTPEVSGPTYPQTKVEEGVGQNIDLNSAQDASGSTSIDRKEAKSGTVGGLGALPSIATAASAMQIENDASQTPSTTNGSTVSGGDNMGTLTAGPNMGASPLTPGGRATLVDAMRGHVLDTPISAHSIGGEGLSAMTPTTPSFSMSATTPTTPFSPSLLTPVTPGGSRAKHTCNHCAQTFTRHHNLKSHLLTHSHEKPYVCTSCQARFRRLHDLKRHTKLHTGERPHMCDKCGRRFARGDALARHARGEGGCAGRRSSMAGMAGEDAMLQEITADGDEDINMLVDDADGDIEMPDGSENASPSSGDVNGANGTVLGGAGPTGPTAKRHASLPSIKTNMNNNHLHPFQQHAGHPAGHALHSHSTYPPPTSARSAANTAGTSPGGLFPPTTNNGSNIRTPSTTTSPNMPNSALSTGTSALANASHILQQVNLTDSPRPVSPGSQAGDVNKKVGYNFNRQQSQQQSVLPSPMTPQSATQPPQPKQAGKYQSHSYASSHPDPSQQNQNKQTPSDSSATGTGRPNPNMFENEIGLWDYVVKLERRLAEVERELSILKAMNHHQTHMQTAAAAVAKVNAVSQAQQQGHRQIGSSPNIVNANPRNNLKSAVNVAAGGGGGGGEGGGS